MDVSVTLFLIGTLAAIFLKLFGLEFARVQYLVNNIPGPSLWELITVHRRHIFGDQLALYLAKICETYKHKLWGVWFYNNFLLIVSDCETMSEIYKRRTTADKPKMFYESLARYVGDNLLTINGTKHRRHRKILNPAFRKAALEAHLGIINEEAILFAKKISEKADGNVVDVRGLVEEFVCGVTLLTFFSERPSNLENLRPMFGTFNDALKEVHLRAVNPFYYWLVHKLKASTQKLESSMNYIIQESRKEYLAQKIRVSKRLDSSHEEKKPRNVLEVLSTNSCVNFQDDGFSEARAVIAAGFDTTSFTTNVSLLLLAIHQNIQDLIFDEIQSIFGDSRRPVEPQDLQKMVHLEMAIKETLRLFPPAPVILKKADEDVHLKGVIVPKGCVVCLNLLALHRNPKYFKDPLKFDPTRFSPESSQGRHPFAFIPFSAGSRNCPGQLQAMMVLKTALCHVIRNFKILPGDGLEKVEDIKVVMNFTFHLDESSLRFLRRNSRDSQYAKTQ